jgi:hypothetical protein
MKTLSPPWSNLRRACSAEKAHSDWTISGHDGATFALRVFKNADKTADAPQSQDKASGCLPGGGMSRVYFELFDMRREP